MTFAKLSLLATFSKEKITNNKTLKANRMKESNKVFLRMILAVSKFLKGNNVLATMQAIKDLVARFDILTAKSEKLVEFIETENKSIEVAVSAATDKLVPPLYAVMKAEEAYFTKQDNLPMVTTLHTTRAEIQRAPFKTIEATVKQVVKVGRENIAKLNTYNLYDEDLDTVESYMQQLVVAITAQEAYNEEKLVKKEELEALIVEGKELLAEADMVVEIISLTHPAEYKSYTEVRNRKEYTELLFTITVLNSETGKPEENARVVVQSTTKKVKDKPYVLLNRVTGKTGEVRNNKREFDIYEMTVEKIGCETHTQQFTVADNTPLRLEVMLKKKEGLN